MTATERKDYWKGYHTMKRLAYNYRNEDLAYMEIFTSNLSHAFVRGAERAWRYIKRIGVQNITA